LKRSLSGNNGSDAGTGYGHATSRFQMVAAGGWKEIRRAAPPLWHGHGAMMAGPWESGGLRPRAGRPQAGLPLGTPGVNRDRHGRGASAGSESSEAGAGGRGRRPGHGGPLWQGGRAGQGGHHKTPFSSFSHFQMPSSQMAGASGPVRPTPSRNLRVVRLRYTLCGSLRKRGLVRCNIRLPLRSLAVAAFGRIRHVVGERRGAGDTVSEMPEEAE
jgi:hypothetical protein